MVPKALVNFRAKTYGLVGVNSGGSTMPVRVLRIYEGQKDIHPEKSTI